jgi:DnaA regulatory inactivator Hda
MADQLAFDLPHRTALGREDFLISGSNVEAVKLIDTWPDWPVGTAYLYGPKSSGKTHLLKLWGDAASPVFLAENNLLDIDAFIEAGKKAFAVDDVEHLLGQQKNEEALFHLINHIKNVEGTVLITSDVPVKDLPCLLADLHSRLKAAYSSEIYSPDDDLMSALYLKHLSDRQIKIDPDALNFLVLRSMRSFAVILENVKRLDKASLKEKRRLTLPFIKKTLGL